MTDPRTPRWRPHRLLHLLPAHVINGVSVALGIALIHLVAIALFGTQAGAWATSGAIYASLADVPDTTARNWRKVITAGALGSLAVLVISTLSGHPWVLGAGVAAVAFMAAMVLAWGPRAGAVSFAPVLAMVFTMALPPPPQPFVQVGWHLVGSASYVVWSVICTAVLQRRYGSLALADALGDAGDLLRLRGRMLTSPDPAGSGLQAWVDEETRLAERLQTARDLLFAAADAQPARRQAAMLLRAIDLRDVLLASLLDHERLGDDEPARRLKTWLGAHLDAAAMALERVQHALRGIEPLPSSLPDDAAPPGEDALRALSATMLADDPRRRLMPALANRARHLRRDVERTEALCRGAEEELPLSREQLLHFVSPEGWPLEALRRQATLASPVLRHALRSAAALATAYYLALALPWASHPQWLVLSVAVVLRGNLEQTLSRRNARVLGTMAGCVLLLLVQRVAPLSVQTVVFLVAVGFAHGFAVRFYLVTAMAATVMSLLQVHLADPSIPIPFVERLADTVLGALLAWGFSYVLPIWERWLLPLAMSRALQSLQDYASHALGHGAADALAQRLARRSAYDALAAVANALRRSGAEPTRVQPPRAELARFLDQAQRLMAHLSMLRLLRMREDVAQGQADWDAALELALQALRAALVARQAVQGGGGAATAGEPDAWQQMPPVSPTEDMAAWLRWRLRVTAEAGREAGRAARAALALLRPASGHQAP